MTTPSSSPNRDSPEDFGPQDGDPFSLNQPFSNEFRLLSPGDSVGPYEVKRFHARGGSSLVYLASDEKDKRVALKLADGSGGGRFVTRSSEVTAARLPNFISPDETPSDTFIAKPDGGFEISFLEHSAANQLIEKQHEILAKASHRNIIKVLEKSPTYVNGVPVLVMEYSAGETIREKMRDQNPVHLNWFLTATRALISLKKSGGLDAHRSIKPEDIFINNKGGVKLLDPSPHPDEFGGRLITSAYYNPLLLTNSKADVMAMGIMIYEIMTGILPFEDAPYPRAGARGDRDVEDLFLSHYLSYPPLCSVNPNAPKAFEKIVHRCLAIPEYGLDDFAGDLKEFLRAP